MAKGNCVQRVPLFNHLSADEQEHIKSRIHHNTYAKGELIFSPDTREQLTIVSSGRMKVYKLNPFGKEQLIRIVEEGDYDGENYLFDIPNETLYAEALTTTKVCILYKSDFQHLLETYPQIGFKLLNLNAKKTVQLGNQTQLLALDKIENRLATYLIELSASQNQQPLTIPMPLKEVASYLGTSPETLSRQFKRFEKENWISRQGKTITLSPSFWKTFQEI